MSLWWWAINYQQTMCCCVFDTTINLKLIRSMLNMHVRWQQWHSRIQPAHNWVISCCKYWFCCANGRFTCAPMVCACISRNIYHSLRRLQTFSNKKSKRLLFVYFNNFYRFSLPPHVYAWFHFYGTRLISSEKSNACKEKSQVKFSISTR
jgi:hypothetical protein